MGQCPESEAALAMKATDLIASKCLKYFIKVRCSQDATIPEFHSTVLLKFPLLKYPVPTQFPPLKYMPLPNSLY